MAEVVNDAEDSEDEGEALDEVMQSRPDFLKNRKSFLNKKKREDKAKEAAESRELRGRVADIEAWYRRKFNIAPDDITVNIQVVQLYEPYYFRAQIRTNKNLVRNSVALTYFDSSTIFDDLIAHEPKMEIDNASTNDEKREFNRGLVIPERRRDEENCEGR